MDLGASGTKESVAVDPSQAARWIRAAAAGFALLFVLLGIWAAASNYQQPKAIDFLSFWSAGRLALDGNASAAYDIAAHRAVEQGVVASMGGVLSFPYPPPFLLFIAPFAIVSFAVAFPLWLTITGGLYTYASTRLVPASYALSTPPVLLNLLIGQTGLLTSGLFIIGLSLTSTAPVTAGAVLGLLIIKPQLALLLPVAMLAGREWRVIAGAIISSSVLLILAVVLFDPEAYRGFFDIVGQYVGFMRESRWGWNDLASPFALVRYLGVSEGIALATHLAIAAAAALLTARAWWLKLDERVPILAAASLLIPPYLLTYDAVLLIIPFAWLIAHGRHWAFAVLWSLCLISISTYFTNVQEPNLTSLAAILCLWILHRSSKNRAVGEQRA